VLHNDDSVLPRPVIAVDAISVTERLTGAGRALVNMLEHLAVIDGDREYVALVTPPGSQIIRERAPGVTVREVTVGNGLGWELRKAGHVARDVDASLLFTIRELVPLTGPPVVLHVFEPPSYRLGAYAKPSVGEAKRVAKDLLLSAVFRRSVRRAAAVTAGSIATADWLARRAGVQADVVISGIDPAFFEEPVNGSGPVRRAPYVLHPASGDPRENTDLVLRAFSTGHLEGLQLVMFGTPDSVRSRLVERARSLGVDVELTGWISDEELRRLYSGAVAFVHPSKYESYAGYPVLEAMAMGSPVVALQAPGVTEAVEGRGLLIEREEPEELARAIARLRDNAGLADELVAKALRHVRTLTWEAAAWRLKLVFDRVLRSSV
jgi:glycosyltransferase involved in cell wall biosynthesis